MSQQRRSLLTFSKEHLREVIPYDPACHDSPRGNVALTAEPGLSNRFLSKPHWRNINAKGGQTGQHPCIVWEGSEKGSCNSSALAFQCGQDDSAPWKACYLDTLWAQMPSVYPYEGHNWRTKLLPLPTSYRVSTNGWEGSPVSIVHPISTTKEDAGMEGGYIGCVADSWEH